MTKPKNSTAVHFSQADADAALELAEGRVRHDASTSKQLSEALDRPSAPIDSIEKQLGNPGDVRTKLHNRRYIRGARDVILEMREMLDSDDPEKISTQ